MIYIQYSLHSNLLQYYIYFPSRSAEKMEIAIKTNNFVNGSTQNRNQPQELQSYVAFCRLFRFATRTDLVLMVIGLNCSVIMGAVIPIFAYLSGDMVDSFKSLEDLYEQTKKILYYYIFVGTIALVVGTVMYTFWMIAGQRQAVRCRRQYFESLLRQEIAWFDVQNQATITTSFELDSMAFQMAVGEKISILMMVISMLVVGVGISFYLGWILTLIIIGYLPIVLLTWTNHNEVKSTTNKEQDTIYRESDTKIQQSLGTITLVKQMNAENYQVSIQAAILKKIKQIYLNIIARYVCASSLAILTFYLGLALTFWYGSECVFNTEKCPQRISTRPYTPGNIVKIFYSLFLPALSINQLAPCLQKIREAKAAAARIFSIIDREPLIKSSLAAIKPQKFTGIIEFRHVTFAYPKDKTKIVLKNLSMRLDCRHSAIVGKSGSGKSTIFQLIMRYYDPDEGSIFLDEVNLRDLDLQWLRSQIGYVTQQPVLFACSIRENLLLGKQDASQQQMKDALRKAQALDFVSEFQNKLCTYAGNGGSLLSGGQKQRIAIARALLKKPKLLLLDEATSSLDNHSEGEILNTLKYVRQEYITISIANRKRVLRYCNQIYQIDNHSIKKFIRNETERRFNRAVTLKTDEQISTSIQLTTSLPTTCAEGPLCLPESKEYLIGPITNSSGSAVSRQEKVDQQASLLRVFSYALNKKCLVVMAIFFPIADALVIPAVGLMFAKIIIAEIKYPLDPEYYKNEVHLYIYIIVGLAFLGTLTNLLSFLAYSLLAQHSVKHLRLEAIAKIFNMPVAYFGKEGNHSDKITSKLSRSCKTIYSFIKLFTPHLIYVVVNILGSLFGAIVIDWRIGLTSIGLIPLIIVSQAVQLGFIQGLTQSKGKIYGDSSQKINESVMNIRTVLALSSSNIIVRSYNSKIQQIYELISQKCICSGFMYGISYFCQFISVGLLFFLSAVYVTNYNVDVIAVMSALALIIFASITAGNTINFMPEFSEAKHACKYIFSIIDQEDQYQMWAKTGSRQLVVPITGNIEFQNVSFKYEDRDTLALDRFSMKIKRGQTVGIAGPSGCGKSTIFSLILGFYSPTQGRILIEGIDIHDFDLHHLRSSIGLVSQEPSLFNDTIAHNISYNLTSALEEDVVRAAKQANFNPSSEKEVIHQQNLNDTSYNIQQSIKNAVAFSRNAGPKGSHLSGGQKQRVAIARAILRRPNVLLLDEVTSALDAENQEKVLKSLQAMMKRMTTVQITHRLETMRHMDNIYFLSKGKLLESGNCCQLFQRQGYFYEMFKE